MIYLGGREIIIHISQRIRTSLPSFLRAGFTSGYRDRGHETLRTIGFHVEGLPDGVRGAGALDHGGVRAIGGEHEVGVAAFPEVGVVAAHLVEI